MLDNLKLAALDIAANKKNRVIAAQYASKMSPAFSAFFPVDVSLTQAQNKINTCGCFYRHHTLSPSSGLTFYDICGILYVEVSDETPERILPLFGKRSPPSKVASNSSADEPRPGSALLPALSPAKAGVFYIKAVSFSCNI